MSTESSIRTNRDGAVVTLTLSRPEALNALTPAMLEELDSVLTEIATDPEARVVVVTGEGRAFCAGVDLKALAGRSITNGAVGDVLDVPARSIIRTLTTMPQIVVAKVNGHCFTGALELVLGCDLVVAAQEAVFGDTHAKFALRPTWGMSQRLIRLVGVARARQLSYTARTFTGAEAAAWGMITEAVPRAELDAAVEALVAQVLASSPGSLVAYKDLYRVALDGGLADGLAYEAATAYVIPDTEERVAAFR